jgi:hypothetical protein
VLPFPRRDSASWLDARWSSRRTSASQAPSLRCQISPGALIAYRFGRSVLAAVLRRETSARRLRSAGFTQRESSLRRRPSSRSSRKVVCYLRVITKRTDLCGALARLRLPRGRALARLGRSGGQAKTLRETRSIAGRLPFASVSRGGRAAQPRSACPWTRFSGACEAETQTTLHRRRGLAHEVRPRPIAGAGSGPQIGMI